MTSSDMLSINNVAAKLGLSVHQLRRWELMFGLEIKRGRGQQRQYREEDMSVLERIKELVEQGWPTSQIRPQLEAEGLLSPKLIGAPPAPGNPEVLQEAIIGLRNFSERRFIDLSKQIDELRQLLISVTLKQELSTDRSSPWQPMASEYVPTPKAMPAQEITIGPQISLDPPKSQPMSQSMMGMQPGRVNQIPPGPSPNTSTNTSGSPSSNTSGSLSGNTSSSPSSPYSSPYASPSADSSNSSLGGPSGTASTSSSTTTPSVSSSPTEFSQRSMMTGSGISSSGGGSGEGKPLIPDINDAPKPSIDALQQSMSTLDSLFKDKRNTPGLGAGPTDSSTTVGATSSTSSASSLPATGPASQPVRYSTIPPLPSGQVTSTTSASQTPAINPPGASPYAGSPASPVISPTTGSASSPDGFGSQRAAAPGYSGSAETPAAAAASEPAAVPAAPSESASTPTGAGAASSTSNSATPATAWDQAFSATSVDIEAVPASGLYEETGAAETAPAGYSSERNPFTTITGTNTNALDKKPVDSSHPALMGQTATGSPGFTGTASTASGQNLNQTGPLPAHTSVESFAPELQEKLIASQSDSTSTDLPRSDPEAPPPAPPTPIPALPLAAGPQVNFGPNVSAPTPQVTPQRMDDNFGLGEVTDQNYLTVLGRALDLIGWSDEQADSFSLKTFGVPHWDELGRSQAEKLVAHLVGLLKDQLKQ
jgi:DNA-binding transcriptional MerR regulator